VIENPAANQLIEVLRERGYDLIVPTLGEGTIVLGAVETVEDLSSRGRDEQDAGRYRPQRRSEGALFAHAAGAHAWTRTLVQE
jgi:sulfhydrogenase subunit beta (sulfur reductase)